MVYVIALVLAFASDVLGALAAKIAGGVGESGICGLLRGRPIGSSALPAMRGRN